MHPTKLQFSQHELDLVSDPAWILTKNEILRKISVVLSNVHHSQKNTVELSRDLLPKSVVNSTPKISRGENYKGLPYLVLDYPRLFEKGNIFAIRSFFWWGKTISTTLHLSGEWQQVFAEKIMESYQRLTEKDFLLAIGADEWVHDVAGEEYTRVSSLSQNVLKEFLTEKAFLKLSLFSPVNELNAAEEIWEEQFKTIIGLLVS